VTTEDKLILTPAQETTLVKFFESHPIFWNKEDEGFKRKGKKDALIEELATDMGLTSGMIMTWFTSQRSMYGRLLRKAPASGSGWQTTTARQSWNLLNLSFLRSHVAPRTE
jgi:hypothetical protein